MKRVNNLKVTFVRIISPNFVAGFVVGSDRFPKVIGFMCGWSLVQIVAYCRKTGWRVNALIDNYDWKELT